MNVLCWNTNESVFEHWIKVFEGHGQLIQSHGFDETAELLRDGSYEYCFVYLDDDGFSAKVEDVVALRQFFPSLKILAFPYLSSQSAAIRMLSMGINGQCSPYIAKEQLRLVLSVVSAGEIWGGKEFIQQLIKQSSGASRPEKLLECTTNFVGSELLSEREVDVAKLIAEGLSNKEIARDLEVTERTVKAHLTAAFKKLNVKDRLALALLVQRGSS
ncbi:response regulator transcription factor [Marinomonas atlantica]|uniref:response regulator transcription factor n=1 Tax=Marinomonas atlantica TaxID=1806668 RepID=UPI00082FFDD5|nr:response regulator transcription factor [Marinomonas atlantica]